MSYCECTKCGKELPNQWTKCCCTGVEVMAEQEQLDPLAVLDEASCHPFPAYVEDFDDDNIIIRKLTDVLNQVMADVPCPEVHKTDGKHPLCPTCHGTGRKYGV